MKVEGTIDLKVFSITKALTLLSKQIGGNKTRKKKKSMKKKNP